MRVFLLAFAAALVALPALAADDCHLYRVTTVDMGIDEAGGVYVPMTIGEKNVNLLIDTGGVLSMLSPDTVKSLDLDPIGLATLNMTMIGGKRIDHYVKASKIELGGLKASNFNFLVLPADMLSSPLGGTLAPDVLAAYDDDFDFANSKFSLFKKDHCPGQVVYWTAGNYATIAMHLDDYHHIGLKVELNGKEVEATIDTGSSRSLMSLEAAEDNIGVDPKSPDLKLLPNASSKIHSYHYPFKTLSFQGITVNNPDLVLMPNNESQLTGYGRPNIIIGMGVLRQLHLYIAYNEHKIYVTPASQH